MNRAGKRATVGISVALAAGCVGPPIAYHAEGTSAGKQIAATSPGRGYQGWGKDISDLFGVGIQALTSTVGLGNNEGPTPVVTVTVSPSQKPAAAKPTPTPEVDKQAACIAKLPDAVKIGQKIIAGVTAANKSEMAGILEKHHIGGAIDMGPAGTKGYDESYRDTLAAANKQLLAAQSIKMLIGIDQEGGTVQRDRIHGAFASEAKVAQTNTPEQARALMTTQYQYLRDHNYTAVFGPDVDELGDDGHSATGDTRSYSSSGRVVTKYAQAYLDAAQQAGITTFIKHAPGGLGLADHNSDNAPATSPQTINELDYNGHLDPYKNIHQSGTAAKSPVMASSLIIPGLTNGQPFNLSRAGVTGLLRDKLGYGEQVIITDDLATPGIGRPIETAMLQSWQAGVDMGMVVGNVSDDSLSRIIATGTAALQNGQLSRSDVDASVERIYALKGVDACS